MMLLGCCCLQGAQGEPGPAGPPGPDGKKVNKMLNLSFQEIAKQ